MSDPKPPPPPPPSFLRRILELLLLLISTMAAFFFYKSAESATEEKIKLEAELRRVRQMDELTGKCAICLVKPLEIVLNPCGHVCSCKDCVRNLKTCPLCRQVIENAKTVFIAS